MTLWQLLLTAIGSSLVFLFARRALLQLSELMKIAEEERDAAQAARLVSLGCLGALSLMPIIVSSGVLFLLSALALAYGDWR